MTPILLHPDDNVLVLAASIAPGDALLIDGVTYAATADVVAGHKIARQRLSAGDKVVKYGALIGSVTTPIQAGEHVHLHNMKSDYIPTHGRDATGSAA